MRIPNRRFVLPAGCMLLVALLIACTDGGAEPAPADPLPEGETVVATLTPAPATLTPAPAQEDSPSVDDYATYQDKLLSTLLVEPRDYNGLLGLMGNEFELFIWYGTAEMLSSTDAVIMLQDMYLPPTNASVRFDPADLNNVLGGNPFALYPSVAEFAFTQGWGASGTGEAVLFISQNPEGSYYWSGMIYAFDGFAAGVSEPSAWQPLSLTLCQDLQTAMMESLGAGASTLAEVAPFTDYLSGTSGEGCRVTITGTGADFTDHGTIFMQLSDVLTVMGLSRDPMYDGGGPTGTLGGFRRDAALILLVVGWEPSEDASCPDDQPIYACELTPEQRLWTITLDGAMQ